MTSIKLIKQFREEIKQPTPNFLTITTNPDTLNAVCYRFGDLLHGRGFDIVGAFEVVGYSIVPLFAVMENLPFVFIDDNKILPPTTSTDRLLLICGQITKKDVDFINTLSQQTTISAIASLIESDHTVKFPQIYLYTRRDLGV